MNYILYRNVGGRDPSHTKKGPGRYHVYGKGKGKGKQKQIVNKHP